jgi:Type II secretory pathway, pseudopilin PulG
MPSPHPMKSPRGKNAKPSGDSRAFTLLELCLCLAAVGLIAALLLPAFNTSLVRARSVKCMNNLKQLGAAINLYAADNDGYLPQSWVYGNDDADNNWWYLISPYTGGEPMTKSWTSVKLRSLEPPFHCPENKGVDPTVPFNAWVSYKMSHLFRTKYQGNVKDLRTGFHGPIFRTCPRFS